MQPLPAAAVTCIPIIQRFLLLSTLYSVPGKGAQGTCGPGDLRSPSLSPAAALSPHTVIGLVTTGHLSRRCALRPGDLRSPSFSPVVTGEKGTARVTACSRFSSITIDEKTVSPNLSPSACIICMRVIGTEKGVLYASCLITRLKELIC